MSESRLELKVGIFVAVCLAILAALLIQFSRGLTLFRHTTMIVLEAGNVGGLKSRASILMSGVQIGTVSETKLGAEGTNVTIHLKIYEQYVIRSDARFIIEQSGFLGDQYIAVYPGQSKGTILTNGSIARAEEPFNVMEVARSAGSLIKEVNDTVKDVKDAIADVRRDVLNHQTLTNLAATADKLGLASDRAVTLVDNVNALITTNQGPVNAAISDLRLFSNRLNNVAASAQGILDTNGPVITATISNLQSSTGSINDILGGVKAGKGLAGALFQDEGVASHVSMLTSNLAVTSSNLNRLGLWHFIWYHPPEARKGGRKPAAP